MQQSQLAREGELFFRQWLRSPKTMGSIIPSSRSLARRIAEQVAWRPGQVVVELGGGTGAISQGLLDIGIPPEALVTIELDPALHGYLKERLKGSHVIRGDATKLNAILRAHGIAEVGTVISGLPMVGMPFEFQRAVYEQGFEALGERGFMLQYSYSPISPVPAKRLGLIAELADFTLLNVPPAFVWRYRKARPA